MRWAAKLCALVVAAAGLHSAAQTGAISSQVIDQYGQPLPHAQIRVCSATSTGVPCTPTVPIYLDYNLTTPVSNPYTTDSYGNYGFYVPALSFPNVYVVQVSPASGITWSYLFDGPGSGGGGGGCTAAGANGTLQASNGSGGCLATYVQVNGSNLASPIAPNFVNSATVTVNNLGTNQISFTAAAASSLAVAATSPITVNGGAGPVSSGTATFACPTCVTSQFVVQVNGTPISPVSPADFVDTASVTWAFTGGHILATSAAGGSTTNFKHNGTTLTGPFAANPQIYDYDESTPAVDGGFTIGTFRADLTTGKWNVEVPISAGGAVMPPVLPHAPAANVIILYATPVSTTLGGLCVDPGGLGLAISGVGAGLTLSQNCFKTIGNFALPSYIHAANVTEVDAFSYSGFNPGNFTNGGQVGAVTSFNCSTSSVYNNTFQITQKTATSTGITGAAIASTSCVENIARNSNTLAASPTNLYVPSAGLIVYYNTDPAPPASTNINVTWPLLYSAVTNTLSLDTAFPNLEYGILFANLPNVLNYTNAAVDVVDCLTAACTAGGGSIVERLYSNGSTWSPTPLAFTLTTNTIPKATGAHSLGDSSITDNGTTVGTTEIGSFGNLVDAGQAAGSGTNCLQIDTLGQITKVGSACSTPASGVLPSAANAGQIPVSQAPGTTYITQPHILYNQPGDTISSIESSVACASACTYVVTQAQTITLSGNHTLNSNVQLDFLEGGLWTVNGAFTLTIPSQVTGTIAPHFAGTSTLSFGAQQQNLPAEWFGADITASAANNVTFIQKCINSLTQGQCTLNETGGYSINAALAFTKDQTGLAGPLNNFGSTTVSYGNTGKPTYLLMTSASASAITVIGTSANRLNNNKFNNFAIQRSVAPSGSARGMDVEFTFQTDIGNVYSSDSIDLWYFKGAANLNLHDGWGFWGQAGVTYTTTTTYNGANFDSTAGDGLNSSRVMNMTFVNANGCCNATYRGVYDQGSFISDLKAVDLETAHMTYGFAVNDTSGGSGQSSFDVHCISCILDSNYKSAVLITNLRANQSGAVELNGGEYSTVSTTTTPVVDLETSGGVTIRGVQFSEYSGTPTAYVYINGGGYHLIEGNTFANVRNNTPVDILMNATQQNVVANNISNRPQPGNTGTGISLVGSTWNSLTANKIGDYCSVGISLDATSNNNTLRANIIPPANCTTPYSISSSSTGNMYDQNNRTVMQPQLFSLLPACVAGTSGMEDEVSDPATTTWGATLTGTGTPVTPYVRAHCDGSNWTVMGK